MDEAIRSLKQGGVGVLPTDTLYGLVASALNAQAVERVYALRQRDPQKPCIILLANSEELAQFGVSAEDIERAKAYWPGPVSVVLPVRQHGLEHLTRGGDSLAFRVPGDEKLRQLLTQTGPLIAPSANPEGQKPAETIDEARLYFDEKIDFYVDDGKRNGSPSLVVSLLDTTPQVLRGNDA